jgi:subfamily B ATP-binding cassette protein MsbA
VNPTYKKLLVFLKEHQWKIFIVFLLSAAQTFIGGLTQFLTARIISSFSDKSVSDISQGSSISDAIQAYISAFASDSDPLQYLLNIAYLLIILVVLKNIFSLFRRIVNAKVEIGITKSIQRRLYTKMLHIPVSYFSEKKSGYLYSVLITDIGKINASLRVVASTLIIEPISIVVYLSMMLMISWKVTIASFIVLPFAAIIIDKISKSLRRKAKRTLREYDTLLTDLTDMLNGIRSIKLFNSEENFLSNYDKKAEKYFRLSFIQRAFAMMNMPLMDIIAHIAMVIIIAIGGFYVLEEKSMSSTDMLTMIFFLISILQPIRNLAKVPNEIQLGIVSGERVFDVLDKADESDSFGKTEKKSFEDSLAFNHVEFNYGDAKEFSLRDISFDIKKGETVAFVGSSGSGKTTLFNILAGFNSPQSGSITLDGQNINELALGDFRKLISVVSQDAFLFNTSIKENITMSEKAISDSEIDKALSLSNSSEFLEKLEAGLDTEVGDKGAKLSGGQKQRLTIARALIKDSPILLLDEATSALDSESEKQIQHAFDELIKDKTVLVIAHRLSTIKNADRIIVMDQGQIVEEGNHESLLKKMGIYQKLYNIQYAND